MSSSKLKEEAVRAGSKGPFDLAQALGDRPHDFTYMHNDTGKQCKLQEKKRLIFKTTERGKLRLLTLLSSHPFYSNSDLSLLQVNKCLGILDGEKSSRKQDKDKLMNL